MTKKNSSIIIDTPHFVSSNIPFCCFVVALIIDFCVSRLILFLFFYFWACHIKPRRRSLIGTPITFTMWKRTKNNFGKQVILHVLDNYEMFGVFFSRNVCENSLLLDTWHKHTIIVLLLLWVFDIVTYLIHTGWRWFIFL